MNQQLRVVGLVLLGTLTACAAQAGAEPAWKFGVMAGWGFSRPLADSPDDSDAVVNTLGAFVPAVSASVRLRSGLSLETRLGFVQRGAHFSGFDADIPEAHLRMNYLALPVLLRWDGGHAGGLRPYVALGPEIAYRVDGRLGIAAEGTVVSLDVPAGALHRWDWAAHIAGGLEMPVGSRSVFLDASLALGLRNQIVDPAPEEQIHTRTFTLGAGLRF